MEEEQCKTLHIVMFPWLALGHLRPFFNLAKYIAGKGHKISFISTPRNLERAVRVPEHLCHLIHPIPMPLPRVEHLPPEAESSMDVPYAKQQLLKVALDLLEPGLRSFLENATPKPDWIIYDYASHWLPRVARELGIKGAYFSIFAAAAMAFLGSPSKMVGRTAAEDYTVVPDWIPASSGMAFRLHEVIKNTDKDADNDQNVYYSGTSDMTRFALSIEGSDIVIFRSCLDFESKWFEIVQRLYGKPVFPAGFLPPRHDEGKGEGEGEGGAEWPRIREFLDQQKEGSLVYIAFGSEATLTQEQIHELALGLEQCGSPFFWVLSRSFENLPEGFCDRVRDRGVVRTEWAPQTKILGHPAVGGFLTHCGWSSATEGLGFGRVLIMFPIMHDQGLNARMLRELNVGIEIPRDEADGSFTREAVAETVRVALVGEEGRSMRENVRKMKELFASETKCNSYVDTLLHHMMKQ